MFEIHPSAENNFNLKAYSLIKKIEAMPQQDKWIPKFETEVHVAAAITDQDIIGEFQEQLNDYRGNTIAKFFMYQEIRYGLEKDSYKLLVKLAESIQRLPAFSDRLSQGYIEKALFNWLKNAFDLPSFQRTV